MTVRGMSVLPDRVALAALTTSAASCVLWPGSLTSGGYGWVHKIGLAHREVYKARHGEIPPGLQLDHLCHTADISCEGGPQCVHRRCINPLHLEPVTPAENSRRSRPASKASCSRGHPFDEANTYIRADGRRGCRKCRHSAVKAYRARRS